MITMESYLDRIETIIEQIREDLTAVPEGPERTMMEENLKAMERIAREYLGKTDLR